MDSQRSRIFALGFVVTLVVLTAVFGSLAYRALRPQETYRVAATAVRAGDLWRLEVETDRPLFLYAFEESSAGEVHLLFPSATEDGLHELKAGTPWRRDLPGLDPDGQLLLFAGLKPLWSLEEATHQAQSRDASQANPILPLEAFLEVRGVPPVPDPETETPRISALLPPLEHGAVETRGLWARRAS